MDRYTVTAGDRIAAAAAAWPHSFWTRGRGMILRKFDDGLDGMILDPCSAIHTVGMANEIDLIFYDEDGSIMRVVPALAPWRVTGCPAACGVVELPAGVVDRLGACAGDRLMFRRVEGDCRGSAAAPRAAGGDNQR